MAAIFSTLRANLGAQSAVASAHEMFLVAALLTPSPPEQPSTASNILISTNFRNTIFLGN